MANILVIDDSAADRALAGHLLEKQGWTIFYAEDGTQALAQMKANSVDLALTDLNMPELDGLALVQQARKEHPLVPVVLMTAKGNEEIAVQALEAGAASYVPKKLLARDLVEVVQRILDASTEHKSYTRLLTHLRSASFELANDLDMISSLVSYLTRLLRESGMFDESDCHRISTALDEALTNAFYHGNLEVSSEIRHRDVRAFRAMVNQRREAAPYRDRRIRVCASLTAEDAQFVIEDEGPGFDVRHFPDPVQPTNLDQPSGRGVFLMKAFMDDVRYNAIGNQVTLLKRRRSRQVGS